MSLAQSLSQLEERHCVVLRLYVPTLAKYSSAVNNTSICVVNCALITLLCGMCTKKYILDELDVNKFMMEFILKIGSHHLIFGKLVTVHSVAMFAVKHCGNRRSLLFGM